MALIPLQGGLPPRSTSSPRPTFPAVRVVPNPPPSGLAPIARTVPLAIPEAAAAPLAVQAVGRFIAPPLALLGAFSVGYSIGTQLLTLWSWMNQALQQQPKPVDPQDVYTWPTPSVPNGMRYQWIAEAQGGAFPPGPTWSLFDNGNTYGIPYLYLNGGSGQGFVYRGANPKDPGTPFQNFFSATNARLSLIGYTPDPGVEPVFEVTPFGNGVDRTPLIESFRPAEPVTVPDSPQRLPLPVVPIPVPVPAPAPAPGQPAPAPGRSVPAPAPGVRPGTQPAPDGLPQISPAPGQQPRPQPEPPTMPEVDPARPPLPLTPPGPIAVPPPVPPPATPPWQTDYGNGVIGQPAQEPRPTPEAIAQELGRQEQKLASLLRGTPGEVGGINLLNDLVKRLLDELLNDQPGGEYQLVPSCPGNDGEEPLPPVVVPVPATSSPTAGIYARLDALADLIQAHKDMGQPSCRTALRGHEVTVHFESE